MTTTQLEALQQQYLQLLLEDALSGAQSDYSLDGQTVSRAAWRDGMWAKIKEIQNLLQFADPYVLRGFTV